MEPVGVPDKLEYTSASVSLASAMNVSMSEVCDCKHSPLSNVWIHLRSVCASISIRRTAGRSAKHDPIVYVVKCLNVSLRWGRWELVECHANKRSSWTASHRFEKYSSHNVFSRLFCAQANLDPPKGACSSARLHLLMHFVDVDGCLSQIKLQLHCCCLSAHVPFPEGI